MIIYNPSPPPVENPEKSKRLDSIRYYHGDVAAWRELDIRLELIREYFKNFETNIQNLEKQINILNKDKKTDGGKKNGTRKKSVSKRNRKNRQK
jgi:hypothetical protein